MKTILAPLDFSDSTTRVVETACSLAAAFHGVLALIHVVKPPSAQLGQVDVQALAEESPEWGQLQDWRDKLLNEGYAVEIAIRAGDPPDCIRQEARRVDADYIVIGSHGHGGFFEIVLGGTVRRLLRDTPCPVLLVPVAPKRALTLDCGAEPGAHASEPLTPAAAN